MRTHTLPCRLEKLENRTLLSASNPTDLVPLGNRLFFLADDGVHGRELWVSDGTAAGTRMVRDINQSSADTRIHFITPFGNKVAFAADDGSNGMELWVSDGTEAGTVLLKDISNSSLGGFPAALTAVGNVLYFSASTNQHGRELWRSDGTEAGTVMVKDLYTGSLGSSPGGFTEVNGTVFFTADVAVTTGQGSHTTTNYYGRELWKTNGTAAGTVMVKDINPGFADSGPDQLTNINGTLFFTAITSELGLELWKSNGTAAGTVLVRDINPTFRSSYPSGLQEHNGAAFFNAVDGNFDQSLWRSDGTAGGTVIASDFAPGFPGIFISANFIEVGQNVFFIGLSQDVGVELWRTDHTAAGTALVREILSPEIFAQNPYIQPVIGRAGQQLFFTAFDPAIGLELYVTDGITTRFLRDIFPGNAQFDPSPQNFTDVNGRLFFTANDGVHGTELWTSDGTVAGTRRVSDPPVAPGPFSKVLIKRPAPVGTDQSVTSSQGVLSLISDADDAGWQPA